MDKYGLEKDEDMARFNIGTIYATITNTVPTAFWMLSFVLGDEELKEVIRREVENVVKLEEDKKRIVLDVDELNETKCPVLTSSFWETLRMVNAGTSMRWVEEDIVVDGYLLKKGAVVQMPAGVLHHKKEIWGQNEKVFDGWRFVKKEGVDREERKLKSKAFIPFGGGKHLCPGRHVAFAEVVSFVAVMIYGFEVKMKSGEKAFKVPDRATMKVGNNTRNPASDVEVIVKQREELKDVEWGFEVGSGVTADVE